MSNNKGIPGGSTIAAQLKRCCSTHKVETVEDLVAHLKERAIEKMNQPDPLIGVFEEVPDEERQYWAKKRATEAALEEPEITYTLEGNRCVCRQA